MKTRKGNGNLLIQSWGNRVTWGGTIVIAVAAAKSGGVKGGLTTLGVGAAVIGAAGVADGLEADYNGCSR